MTFFFEGIGFGDGSGLQGASVHSLKTGRGVTSSRFDEQGRIVITAEAWRPLGGYLQEVNRAEVYAFISFYPTPIAMMNITHSIVTAGSW